MNFVLPTWEAGSPPHGVPVAMACRKWVGYHKGQYIEVVAGDPTGFLAAIDERIVLEPRVKVFTGKVVYKGDIPYILNEHGAPAGYYPDSIVAWSHIPDGLADLSASASANMVLHHARTS